MIKETKCILGFPDSHSFAYVGENGVERSSNLVSCVFLLIGACFANKDLGKSCLCLCN